MRIVESNPGVINRFSHRGADRKWVATFFSNMYRELDGTCVEIEYQGEKMARPEDKAKILACTSPYEAKKLAETLEARPDWDQVKFQIMAGFVLRKFLDHPELAAQLLATGDALIVEGNDWHDNTWGDCYCDDPDHPECKRPGMNWLGQILMCVREVLRDQAGVSNGDGKMPIGPIPTITSTIRPEQIDATSAICGGFGSSEREIIAQAVVIICRMRDSWLEPISAEDIKTALWKLGRKSLGHPAYNLEAQAGFDGFFCPGVGDGLLLQKTAEDTYAVTDEFIETCYRHSPMK